MRHKALSLVFDYMKKYFTQDVNIIKISSNQIYAEARPWMLDKNNYCDWEKPRSGLMLSGKGELNHIVMDCVYFQTTVVNFSRGLAADDTTLTTFNN